MPRHNLGQGVQASAHEQGCRWGRRQFVNDMESRFMSPGKILEVQAITHEQCCRRGSGRPLFGGEGDICLLAALLTLE
eukprot:scaffold219604_cov15-Tisochrysis_lutea.AAC.1